MMTRLRGIERGREWYGVDLHHLHHIYPLPSVPPVPPPPVPPSPVSKMMMRVEAQDFQEHRHLEEKRLRVVLCVPAIN